MKTNEYILCDDVCEKDVLRYGEIIFDSKYVTWIGIIIACEPSAMKVICMNIEW